MRCVVLALFTIPALLLFSTTPAQAGDLPTRVVPVSGAPVAIANCKSDPQTGHVTVVNRTRHDLLTLTVQFKAYDVENTMIGSSEVVATLNEPLTPDDTDIYDFGHGLVWRLSESQNALASITCRVMAATFTGRKTWQFGQTWSEHLLPLSSTGSDGASGGTSNDAPRLGIGSSRGTVKIAVLKAWNDTVNAATYVHDQVALTAGSTPATVAPYELTLTMQLANGGEKTYYGLAKAAPTYQKFNPAINQIVDTPEIDPATDFGKIGTMQIPAKGTATVIVTFLVTDVVADASQNGAVAIDPRAHAPADSSSGDDATGSDRAADSSGSGSHSSDSNAASKDAHKATQKSAASTSHASQSPKPKATNAPGR